LAAALTRVMRATVPIPALASASVLQSAAVGGSVVGVVGPLWTFGELKLSRIPHKSDHICVTRVSF